MAQRPRQLDLLDDWTPPPATVSYEPAAVRAASFPQQLCKAVTETLKATGQPREKIARLMSEFLGAEISKNMLDAYTSPAREDHVINVERFFALLHVTRDRRLLELLAEPLGWAVIERKYLPLIELAAVQERREELGRAADALRRQAKQKGAL